MTHDKKTSVRARLCLAAIVAAGIAAVSIPLAPAAASSDVQMVTPPVTTDPTTFWTPERMLQADHSAEPGSGPGSAGASPAPDDTLGAAWPGGGLVESTVGRLFFVVDENGEPVLSSCSGNVVDSANGSVFMTADHCAHGRDYVFVPGYHNGEAPFGEWTVEAIHQPSDQSLLTDFAAFTLDELNGERVQDVVGAQQISFDGGKTDHIWAFGYPRERTNDPEHPWGGERLIFSEGASRYDALGHVGVGSSMSSGVSGGPFFADFDPTTGTGTQVSVVSGSPCLVFGEDGSCEFKEESTNGIPFNDLAKELYERASHM